MNNELIEQPIPKLIRKIATPASIGFFFSSMYNVVDTYWAGQLSTTALAAMTLSFPIFFLIIALGSGVGQGVTALVTNALGANDKEKAKTYATQSLTYALIATIILMIVGLFATPYLLQVMNAPSDVAKLAIDYTTIIFLGTFSFIITFAMNSLLNSTGDTKTFRNALVISFVLNIVLDPLFAFGGFGLPAMGVAGIALATIVTQLVSMAIVTRKLLSSGLISLTKKHYWPSSKVFREISVQGLPSALNFATIALGYLVMNAFVSPFGTEATAAFGIGTRVDQIALLPSIGLNIAALTLMGQNNGAKKINRVKEAYSTSIIYGLIISGIGTIAVFLFPEFWLSLFTDNPAVMSIGVTYLRVSSLLYCSYIFLFIGSSALQAFKKPLIALAISVSRQVIFLVPSIILFVEYFKLRLLGIWVGTFIVIWLAAIVTTIYVTKLIKEKEVTQK